MKGSYLGFVKTQQNNSILSRFVERYYSRAKNQTLSFITSRIKDRVFKQVREREREKEREGQPKLTNTNTEF